MAVENWSVQPTGTSKAASHSAATTARGRIQSVQLVTCLSVTVVMLATLATVGCGGVSTGSGSGSGSGDPGSGNPFAAPGAGPSGSMFGIATNVMADPWPGTMIPLTSWRSLGGTVKWADINTGPGVYDFTRLDDWLQRAQTSSTDVMFTMYATPSWASSRGVNSGNPNTSCVDQGMNGPGICDPPADLACDGTGSNASFQAFVQALISHVGPGKIKYWEMWNEPNVPTEWNGPADCGGSEHDGDLMLARMAKDMRTIVLAADPDAKFTTPAAVGNPGSWLTTYLPIGGSYADIIAFHGYINNGSCPSDCPVAEKIGDLVDKVTTSIASLPTSPVNFQTYPLFDTEGSWGSANGKQPNITDADQQAAFVARYYLVQMSKPVTKFFWYGWDFAGSGTFYDSSTNSPTLAGTAYQQIVGWTSAGQATVGPCTQNSTQWTCEIESPSGLKAEAIWDTSQKCNNGKCTTTNVAVSSQFNSYVDLAGNVASVPSQGAPVGLKPILVFAD